MLTRVTQFVNQRRKRRRPLRETPAVRDEQMIFICGLHRSGTSVLHRVMQHSDDIVGLTDTGAPEDEGQHVQTVFQPGHVFGGPGRFAFDPRARMTEASVRDRDRERSTLLREWGAYAAIGARNFIEKSPPNLIRSRYFQALFPKARFIFIVRHPLAVALATEKWTESTDLERLLHWDVAHTLMLADLPRLKRSIVLRYEDLTRAFEAQTALIANFLDLAPFESSETMSDQNGRYFALWESRPHVDAAVLTSLLLRADGPMRRFGYDFSSPYISSTSFEA